jgi:hypothetical protein
MRSPVEDSKVCSSSHVTPWSGAHVPFSQRWSGAQSSREVHDCKQPALSRQANGAHSIPRGFTSHTPPTEQIWPVARVPTHTLVPHPVPGLYNSHDPRPLQLPFWPHVLELSSAQSFRGSVPVRVALHLPGSSGSSFCAMLQV